MKFATLKDGSRDGRLAVVSRDLQRACLAGDAARTLRDVLDHWDTASIALQTLYDALNAGAAPDAFALDPAQCMAPLPRTHQFVDASAFLNHGKIMVQSSGASIKLEPGVCLLVPRQADDFRGPTDPYEFPAESDDCDFEGEFAVITGDVPMGATPAEALASVRLVTLLNDVSMRKYQLREIQMGFGLIRSKTATAFAPIAVTPDELGDAWADGRIHLDLHVWRNGEWFGHPNGREMDFSLGDLLAYIAYNRRLGAGFVLGTGTVSNAGHAQVGSACLAERRALETIAHGAPRTAWMHYGERLRFEARDAQGASVFGAIDMSFVPAGRHGPCESS